MNSRWQFLGVLKMFHAIEAYNKILISGRSRKTAGKGYLKISSVERQKGLTTSHLHMHLDPFASELTIFSPYNPIVSLQVYAANMNQLNATRSSSGWAYQVCKINKHCDALKEKYSISIQNTP